MRGSSARGTARGGRTSSVGPPASRGAMVRPAHVGQVQQTAMTAKGRGIQEDLEALDRDYFGEPSPLPNKASATTTAAATAGTNPAFSRTVPPASMPLSASWTTGPADPSGRLMDASDRNLLCMDLQGDLVVAGGADHGLTVWNFSRGRKERTLFSKTCGHSEWVTSCAFLPGGQIVSGGMDSSLWLWNRAGSTGTNLSGRSDSHSAGISTVAANENGTVLSASYDRTVKVWSVGNGRGTYRTTLSGHKAPVTHLHWQGGVVLSGDRKGTCILWDLETSAAVTSLATTGGQVGSLGSIVDAELRLVFAGDQAGTITGWDPRTDPKNPVMRAKMHPGAVVSAVHGTTMGSDNFLITAGADKHMYCFDPHGGFNAPLHSWTDHKDFIYEVTSHANVVFSSGGNGWLLAHDVDSGKCAYGIGAGENAMRCIKTTDHALVCAGDDGKIMAYEFP